MPEPNGIASRLSLQKSNDEAFLDATFSEWMAVVAKLAPATRNAVHAFLDADYWKVERLQKLNQQVGLPIDEYLIVAGNLFNCEAEQIRSFFSDPNIFIFAVRAVPLCRELTPQRALGVSQSQVFEYVQQLPGGAASYRIYVWEYFVPEFSGTIITSGSGLLAEVVRGRHILLTQQAVSSTEIIRASLIFPNYRVIYSTASTVAQNVIWGAIKQLMINKNAEISPLSLPELLKGYSEFVYHSNKGYRFIDFNDSSMVTSLPFDSRLPEILP